MKIATKQKYTCYWLCNGCRKVKPLVEFKAVAVEPRCKDCRKDLKQKITNLK